MISIQLKPLLIFIFGSVFSCRSRICRLFAYSCVEKNREKKKKKKKIQTKHFQSSQTSGIQLNALFNNETQFACINFLQYLFLIELRFVLHCSSSSLLWLFPKKFFLIFVFLFFFFPFLALVVHFIRMVSTKQ